MAVKKKQLDKKYVIEKRNTLNELRAKDMTLQELRLFCIYLAKINARDENTRVVRLPLDDYRKIMNLGRLNINQLKVTTNKLLTKVVNIPNESGGYSGFVLFQECEINKDDNDGWYIEINASNKALPLMFNVKKNYFKYELWNALNLKSSNQLRMYEILKQHEYQGEFTVSIEELRALLGVDEYENRFDMFKKRVIESCQKALAENTDISFTYEKAKAGKGGKWLSIKFTIKKNENYKNQLNIEEFLNQEDLCEIESIHDEPEQSEINEFREYFSAEENDALISFCKNMLIKNNFDDDKLVSIIMENSLNILKIKVKEIDIKHPFDYIKKIIETQVENEIKESSQKRKMLQTNEQSYDINEFENFAITFSKNTKKQSSN